MCSLKVDTAKTSKDEEDQPRLNLKGHPRNLAKGAKLSQANISLDDSQECDNESDVEMQEYILEDSNDEDNDDSSSGSDNEELVPSGTSNIKWQKTLRKRDPKNFEGPKPWSSRHFGLRCN